MASNNPFKVGDRVTPHHDWNDLKLLKGLSYEVQMSCEKFGRIEVEGKLFHHSHFKPFIPTPVPLDGPSFERLDGKTASDGGSTSYYAIPEGSKELFDLINHQNMNFAVGNIFKACWRLGRKQGIDTAYDLRKIIFMAEQELKRIGR